ncbi:MAG: methyltransferase domain-containing protein [Rhodospirillales bacterium]|nr:methyltransferase domain-containing protein [Rhodospirillales bacterium]
MSGASTHAAGPVALAPATPKLPRLSAAASGLIRCPSCGAHIEVGETVARCRNDECAATFHRSAAGTWDLRLTKPKVVLRTSSIGIPQPTGVDGRVLANNPTPEVDWSGMARPKGLRRRLQSHLPRATVRSMPMLDVGCGTADLAPVFRHCGFEYVGVDVCGDAPSVLADAMALPFADESFGFAWSNAVLQYVSYPDVALAEIARVLQPGAVFIGSIGFIETFDGANMHLTTWRGARQLFADAGFTIEHLGPDDRWTGTLALFRALFPGLPFMLSSALVSPVNAVSRLYWQAAHRIRPAVNPNERLVKITGGLEFILRKPAQ